MAQDAARGRAVVDGEIVWWREAKGYGFLRPVEGGDDIAFRLADAALPPGSVAVGMAVHFTLRHDAIGPLAVRLAPGHRGEGAL